MLYDFTCHKCGAIYEVVRPIARCTDGPECCGEKTERIYLKPPMGFVDNMEEYICPVTNQGVTTRYQRNEIMKREGLVDANDFLRSDEERDRITREKAEERKKAQEAIPKELTEQVDKWATKELNL